MQTRSKVKPSGITLPGLHGVGKGLDPSVQAEKQVMKPMISKARKVSHIKLRLE